jgi:hypothetical protein
MGFSSGWLKFSTSLSLKKNKHFSKVSTLTAGYRHTFEKGDMTYDNAE